MNPYASLYVLLCLFWVLLSGYFTPFLLAAGAGSSLAVVWLSHRMGLFGPERRGRPGLRWGLGLATYWIWLLAEIARSAWSVTRVILDPRLPISPTVVRIRPLQKTDLGLVIHANSITLTPGTITIEVEPDHFVVHGITRSSAAGVIDSEMDTRVARLEAQL
ncbi:MAG: Na+/H+ antiporter subunit E [Caldimonas sp.]